MHAHCIANKLTAFIQNIISVLKLKHEKLNDNNKVFHPKDYKFHQKVYLKSI